MPVRTPHDQCLADGKRGADLTIHRHQKLVRTIIRMHAELRVRRENEWPDRERVR